MAPLKKSRSSLAWNVRATTSIVALNLLAFAATYFAAGSTQIDIDTLIRFGANDRAINQQSWRLIACTFLHVDVIALFANMWWLLWTGRFVERWLGSRLFVMCYLLCAVCASMTSTFWNPTAVSVGASGAVWGVWGLVIAMRLFDSQSGRDKQLRTVCGFVVIAIVADLCSLPLRSGIDTAAHVGGLLTGITCGAVAIAVAGWRQFVPMVWPRWAVSQ